MRLENDTDDGNDKDDFTYKLIGIPKNSETWMERQSFGSSKVFFSNLLSKQAIHQSNQAQNLLGVELLYFICIFNLLSD